MKSKNVAINLYAELGKLLYAIADIDRNISEEEKKKLMDIVHQELIPSSNQLDEYGTNVGFYALFEFDFLDEEITDASGAFESFMAYYDTHQDSFDMEMKELVLRIVDELAGTSYGINKKERKLIDQLTNKLQVSIDLKALT